MIIIAPYWDSYPEEGGKGPDDGDVVMMCIHIQTGVTPQGLQSGRITCLPSTIVFGE